MACLDHQCRDPKCGWTDMSNRTVHICPRCCGPVSNYFDEPPEHDEPDDFDDEEDEE